MERLITLQHVAYLINLLGSLKAMEWYQIMTDPIAYLIKLSLDRISEGIKANDSVKPVKSPNLEKCSHLQKQYDFCTVYPEHYCFIEFENLVKCMTGLEDSKKSKSLKSHTNPFK